jgi:hypothetical protein
MVSCHATSLTHLTGPAPGSYPSCQESQVRAGHRVQRLLLHAGEPACWAWGVGMCLVCRLLLRTSQQYRTQVCALFLLFLLEGVALPYIAWFSV